jgi:hypothetical protein
MRVEIEISDELLKKLKALSILKPLEGGIDTAISHGLESWVDQQIVGHIMGGASALSAPTFTTPAPDHITQRRPRRGKQRAEEVPSAEHDAYDASGISDGLSDDEDNFEDETRTSDPEAFIRPTGGLTEESVDRDMRVADPEHEAKVDASVIKEKKLSGSDSYRTPEQLFADHSGLPTPPPVAADERARKRRKTQSGRGRASQFTGHEEHTI